MVRNFPSCKSFICHKTGFGVDDVEVFVFLKIYKLTSKQRDKMSKENMLEKIKDGSITVGIIGLGYVGLPLFLEYASLNIDVVGFDIDKKKISSLVRGKSYIERYSDGAVATAIAGSAQVTSKFDLIADCDAVIICVPTPLNRHREPDLSFVTSTLSSVEPFLRSGQMISLESTTWPGTTEEILVPIITNAGFAVGQDVFVVFSPEREDPGNKAFTTHSIPKIVGGVTADCLEIGQALYSLAIEKVVSVSSPRVAEMTKLLENIHRAVNIGLVNEMKIVTDQMGIDIFEVVDAAATKPFGFTAFYPGPGLGGHCIPVDPFYLTWKAREYGVHTRFIELSGEINKSMPSFVMGKLAMALNEIGKPIKNSRVLILGVAYKRDVDDIRESPSLELIDLLKKSGALVTYSDPYVSALPKTRAFDFNMAHVEVSDSMLAEQDAVIVATNHTDFDYDFILRHATLIIDTRGVYRELSNKVIRS